MAEAVSSRITRLNQLLSGKTAGKKVPLLDKETLLDAFVALYNECNTDYMTKDKNIATYVKKFKPLICEIEKLRLRKNDFEIRKTIGRGHFGEVHVVREKVTGNVYAMKVLKKSETLSQDNVAFFEEERDIMAFAGNPWITSLQYAFQDYESLYLVMDFHPGGDLLSLLAKYDDIFEENVAQFYLAEMIMAMHAVHVLGYVHRDIKPENVLIDRTGHIKLADFGSSAKLSSSKTVVSKMPVGTPEYIAPEVLTSMDGSGGGGKYGIECDWWSLGVVAYEMMIGNTPFQADTVVVVYSQIMNFKNSLEFPDDQPLTDNAKDLIRSLLTDQKNRIGYNDLAKHPFFTGLDWTTLQDAVPPYVPNVQREDDTSNFDDFETENSGPRIEDFMQQKQGFLGKDLPFIGFTFTKQLTLASLNETIGDVHTPSQGLVAKRASTKREMSKDGTMDKQVVALRHDLEKEQKKAKELKQVIEDKLKQIKDIERERDGLENDKAIFETEKKDLKRLYDKEKLQCEKYEAEINVLRNEVADANKKAEGFLSDKINSSKNEEQVKQLELEKSTLTKKIQHLESSIEEKEKYLEDSKSRITDLQSKLAKVNEDTKSNVTELQQKLFKVNEDNENRIRLFQEKLTKAVTAAQEAVEQLGKTEKEKEDIEKENAQLKASLQQEEGERHKQNVSYEEIEKLQAKISLLDKKNESLKNENKELQEDLEDSRNKYDKLVEFGEDLKAQVERKIEKLQREIVNSKEEIKKSDERYKKLKEEYDEKNNNLNDHENTIASLKATCESLEKELKEINSNKELTSKQQEQAESSYRMELTHKMNEVNAQKSKIENENATLKHDLKENQTKFDELKEQLNSLKKQYDELTETSENSISKLNRELQKATNESKKYQKELAEAQNSNDQLKTAVISLEAEANSLKLKSDEDSHLKEKDMEMRINKANVAIDNLRTDKLALENKVQSLSDQLITSQKDKEQLQEEVNEKERQANSQDLTIQMLKQTCTMLEGQVEDLEVMNDEYQDREAKWDLIKRQQYQAQEQLEQQLTDALNSLEQQRQLKNQANLKLQQLEENNASAQGDVTKKLESVQKLSESQEEKIQELSNSLSDAEKNLGLNMVTIKNLERKLAVETDEKNRLTAEVSHLEDLSSQQTSSNFALTVEIEELKERNDELIAEKDSAQNQLEQDAIQHAEEKIKLESTLAQQTKLIEFLQKKFVVEDKNYAAKKHKSKGGKTKLDLPPTEAPQDIRKTKDLERALEKEKNANLTQHLQLQKAKNEITSLKTELQQLKAAMKSHSNPTTPRLAHKQDVSKTSSSSIYSAKSNSSPSTSVADIYNMPDNEVRGNGTVPVESKNPNNVPHKLHATLNMRPSKCPVCLNTIHFAKQAMKCSECYIVSHAKCASSLPNLCGVPKSLLPQFTINLSRASMILDDGSIAIDVTDGCKLPKLEGWLKFPKKTGTKQNWERKWVVLQDMKLSVFNNDNTIEFDPFDEIDLNISDGELNIHPAIPSSEMSWVAPNDLNYVFSVELLPYTLGWPRRTLYFLSPTFSDKQKWVAALEFLADGVKQKTQKEEHGMVNDIIMSFEGIKQLDVNSSIIINDSGGILGCEEGLYVVSMKTGPQKNKPVQIIGLGPVYQMKLVKELDLVLLVTGKDRLFCSISFKDLENRLKQLHMGASISAISPYQIERVKACHLFKVSRINNEYYACAATTHKLNIFKYSSQFQSFVLKKELETNEAASCLLFTNTSIIYGTSKFHSADLKNYQKRDFLDASDTSLAFAVFGTSQTRSFPIAIFKVSEGKIRDEFLLCFSEFGIFVDWQGRRSRKGDLKWTRLPMSFDYHHPHLYITHFSTIEICEISTDMKFDISATPRRFIDVPDPRFLGEGLETSSVLLASTQVKKLEIISHKAPPPIGLSRNMSISGVSITSGASVANAILEQSGITMDPVLYRSPSKDSVCSDEETSMAIGKNSSSGTPRSSRRNDPRNDKRISFRFFKGNRKSQYDT